jgi:hypothetical protein
MSKGSPIKGFCVCSRILINNEFKIEEDNKLSFVSVIAGPQTYGRGILTILQRNPVTRCRVRKLLKKPLKIGSVVHIWAVLAP